MAWRAAEDEDAARAAIPVEEARRKPYTPELCEAARGSQKERRNKKTGSARQLPRASWQPITREELRPLMHGGGTPTQYLEYGILKPFAVLYTARLSRGSSPSCSAALGGG